MKFNIGDTIRVKENAPYSFTGGGSVGVIVGIIQGTNYYYKIKFSKLSVVVDRTIGNIFYMPADYLILTKESIPTPTGKYAQVISKIKEMEQRRKEKGYEF